MKKGPRIADVKCAQIEFRPGDRLLVKTYHDLEPEARRRLRRTVQRWAGEEVEVLILNRLEYELHLERNREAREL